MYEPTKGDKVRWRKSRGGVSPYARGVVIEVRGVKTLVGRPDLDQGDTTRWEVSTDKLELLPADARLH